MSDGSISRRLRDEMLVAVGHRCVRCFSDAPEVDLHHITPISRGGLGVRENLVVLCPTCHRLAHRYAFSHRQLKLYEREAVRRRKRFEPHEMEWSLQSASEYAALRRDEMLERLSAHVKAWYNDFVVTVVRAKGTADNRDARELVAKYILSREHLPDVVAIKMLLDRVRGLESLASDVEVFIRLLVRVDPCGALMCLTEELRDIPDICDDWGTERTESGVPSENLVMCLQRQVQAITNVVYEIRFGSESRA